MSAGPDSSLTSPTLLTGPFTPESFVPRRWLTNGHVQTIAGNFLRRRILPGEELPAGTAELVQVSPVRTGDLGELSGQRVTRVLAIGHWQPEAVRAERLTVLLLHGLEGSSESQYILGNARKLWHAGMNVIRMNMRNCGGTEAETPTLYHSGMSGDVAAVLAEYIRRFGLRHTAVVGYSMGGNLVMKLAGEIGRGGSLPSAEREVAPTMRAAVGVSPAVDLGPSADALHRPINRVYEYRFLTALVKRFRRKVALFPRVYDPARADGLTSLRAFDDRVTAFYSGFTGADDYYFRAAAARVLTTLAVPTLVIHADDDPFVRIMPESRTALTENPQVTLLEPAHGGHCAFLSALTPSSDGYWAESTLLEFLRTVRLPA